MNEFEKIKYDIDEATAKKIKKLLKGFKKSQDDMIECIAAIIIKNMDETGAIIMSPSMTYEIREGVTKTLNELTDDEVDFLNNVLESGYNDAFAKTAKAIGMNVDWDILRKEFISRAVGATIDGKRYSDRVWDNTEELANRIYNDILECIKTGKRPNAISRQIKKDFGVTAYQAARLVNTELARVVNAAQIDVYENSGVVDKVMFSATLENNTCDVCGDLDGKKFSLHNAPKIPVHPNCRCCLIPIVDDWKPTMRADNSTKTNIKYTTFNKWKQQ